MRNFLDYVRDHASPLDFFSFHSYDTLKRLLEQVGSVALEMKHATGFARHEQN